MLGARSDKGGCRKRTLYLEDVGRHTSYGFLAALRVSCSATGGSGELYYTC